MIRLRTYIFIVVLVLMLVSSAINSLLEIPNKEETIEKAGCVIIACFMLLVAICIVIIFIPKKDQ